MATWVGYPNGYSPGRNRPVQYVVIHYTAGSEGPTSAEAGADYDKRRTDGTSTHCFADSNSVVREVPDADRAHHARYHGNEIGLGLEICGTAQTRAQWLDAVSLPTLRMAAKQTAEWCTAHQLPVRRLSVAETRAAYYNAPGSRPKGIVGHVDCTYAYPEDGGTHEDPGKDFPWDVFLGMVNEEMGNDVNLEERSWLYNASSIAASLGRGLDSAKTLDNHGNAGTLDLRPYWARVAAEVAKNPLGTVTVDVDEAAIAKAVVDEDHRRSAD